MFLDKSFEVTDFGKSDKFALVQNNENLYKNEIKYIKEQYKYAKTIYITSKYITALNNEQIIIEHINDIKEILKENSFNAVYIIGFNYDDIYNHLIKLEKQESLF